MKFCTVLRNESAVRDLLVSRSEHYEKALDRVRGHHEWTVRAFRNMDLLRARVAASERRVEDSLGAISKGVVTFVKEEMNRLDSQEDGEALELMSEHCAQRSHAALCACSADGVVRRKGEARESDVVLQASYLVADGDEELVREEVERLQSEYDELGFRFELTGPWPPYHFVETDDTNRTVGFAG